MKPAETDRIISHASLGLLVNPLWEVMRQESVTGNSGVFHEHIVNGIRKNKARKKQKKC